MALIVTLNVGHSLKPKYEAAAGPGVRVSMGPVGGGLSSVYEALAKEQSLLDYLREHGWDGSERAVVVGFSAGCFAPRYWLKQEPAPAGIGFLLLDGLHGDASRTDGVIAAALEAARDPAGRLMVITNTDYEGTFVSTSEASSILLDAVAKEVPVERTAPDSGHAGGLWVIDYDGAHNTQQTDVGPELVQELVKPWLAGSPVGGGGSGGGMFWPLVLTAGLAAAGWWWWYKESRR
jgi:hypothetical protein